MTRIWRHKQRGSVYFEIGRGELQSAAAPSWEGATMVVYRGEDGKLWVREQREFDDGRFEELHAGAAP